MRKFIVCLTAALILSACGNSKQEVTVAETTVTQEEETKDESVAEETATVEETTDAFVQETDAENDDIKYRQDVMRALLVDDFSGYENGSDTMIDWKKAEDKYDNVDSAIDKWVDDYGAYLKGQDYDEDFLYDFTPDVNLTRMDEESIEAMKENSIVVYCDFILNSFLDDLDKTKESHPDFYIMSRIVASHGYYSNEKIEEMMTTLNQNALRASKQYLDKQIMIEGILSAIDSSGKYITVTDGGQFSIVGCTCFIKNDEQIDKVAELNTGQKIYVLGTITQVGEALGYAMDIVDIYTEEDLNEL